MGPGLVQIAAEHAVAMAVGVEGAGVDEQDLRGMLPDDIAGHTDIEIVDLGPLHEVFLAALFIALGQILGVALDNVQHGLAGSGICKAAAQSIAGVGHPVLGHQPVDIGVPRRDGPGDRAGGVALLFGGGKDVLHMDVLAEPQPLGVLIGGGEIEVAGDAVLTDVAAGHHRDVGGIGDGGIDGPHTTGDLAAAGQILLEIGQLPQGVYVLTDHGVSGKD